MRIVSWNVNGIRSVHKKGLFEPMIKSLRPDILCLQETKAEQHQSVVDLPDYEEYWNSASKKGYSGTAIFSKVKPLAIIRDFPAHIIKKYKLSDGYGDLNSEGRVIAAEFDDFFVVNVYTPNSKDDLSRLSMRHQHWDPAFLEYCKELEAKKAVIFCGDLNVAHTSDDLANPKANEGAHGFTKESGHYSWWKHWANARERNVGWRIDYIFVSKKLSSHLTSAKIHPDIFGSDHCPVSIVIGD